MTSRIGVAVMAVCLALYIVVVGQRAVVMMTTGEPIALVIGAALIVMPIIGVWALYREIRFGFAADRLGRTLDAEGGMPQAEGELTASGRIAREDVEPMPSIRDVPRVEYVQLGGRQPVGQRRPLVRRDARPDVRAELADLSRPPGA